MNRIRLLSEQVSNQIAAGEVVERPASVVKELVENSLDAGANCITVEIQAGGRSLIRVTDDGLGMSRDDALLCLERHATSKIQRAEDLAALSSMGFRGEALPSIASVSRMSLTTRERESSLAEANQVIIHGGRIVEVKAAGAPPGTSVEVRQLFFNLPARRKFLRSEQTEYFHVHHYLTLAALAYPNVAFTFLKDGRVVWQLPAIGSEDASESRLGALRERMKAFISGQDRLIPVDFTATAREPEEFDPNLESPQSPAGPSETVSPFRLWGWIGQPGVARSTREDQHLFVNRRPVENRGLNYALIEGYHTALMKGRYPVCCLFLEIHPALVDVNIHPAKREVKFHNERFVRQMAALGVRQALEQFHRDRPAPSQHTAATSSSSSSSRQPDSTDDLDFQSWSRTQPTPAARTRAIVAEANARSPIPNISPTARQFPGSEPATRTLGSGAASESVKAAVPTTATAPRLSAPSPNAPPPAPAPASPLLHVPLRLVGVVGRLYVVLESDRGLVLLDQHAAHERILFEQMLQRAQEGAVPSQRLLLPETVELSARDAQFLRENLDTLTRLGVGLSEFGERTFLLDSLPPMVKTSDPRRFIVEMIDELKAAGTDVNSQRLGESTIAKTVCRHAVKANDPLADAELEHLVEDLRRCAMPYTCPHGRPTLIEMNYRELEKKFGRLQ